MKKFRLILAMASLSWLTACGAVLSSGNPPAVALEAVPAEFAGNTNPFGADAASVGEAVFMASCKSCHGPAGHGDGPASSALEPSPKNLAELQSQVADDYLYWRISNGKAGTSMIGWNGILADEQIWQVICFIRTLK